ncbi:hypothetical protein Mal4_54950 [Maioricimonas rarisocia]|uniref:Uncharacterized protein n=1 Tax=Maioricimonas rarisocia TaxID=2528026 RepID=A0A517ZF52_9PLAN|nr:hypothetical protein [Maioricimonas rarisocia]QDU41130.1 hypothetical protein Mal4_54950 [Maioricimonas rarisocia]
MSHRFATRVGFTFLLAAMLCGEAGVATAQESPRTARLHAATVLGKKVWLRKISPSEVAQNRARLSAEDFARWQAESRWRPLVSRVSHLVMSDWADQNKVKPTREEIQKLFAAEARQHLQEYATTPEGTRKVALAIGWSTGTAMEWVRAKALHEKYGGPIALSSFGSCIAIDGRNALLKEYAAAGKIEFHDAELEKLFWEGTTSPAVLDVTVSDPMRVSKHFARPPWEGWGARTAEVFKRQADASGGAGDGDDESEEKGSSDRDAAPTVDKGEAQADAESFLSQTCRDVVTL